eukprot:scaffold34093_cov59-Attheya_sp.AAC.2
MKKANLEFRISQHLDWVKSEIEKETEVEVHMANANRHDYDRWTINWLRPYCMDEEKAGFSNVLERNENWLYEDGLSTTGLM